MSSYFVYKEEVILKKLVIKAIKGDTESFTTLLNSKKEDLYRIAYSYVHNEQDALDIIGEAVYKAYISINKLNHPEYFNTWLIRIVINCSINFINKSKKTLYLDNETIENLKDKEINVFENIDLKEALEKLDYNHKTVITLRYFQDLKLKDISDILDIPLSTVKTRLYKAIEFLQIELKEGESFEK